MKTYEDSIRYVYIISFLSIFICNTFYKQSLRAMMNRTITDEDSRNH